MKIKPIRVDLIYFAAQSRFYNRLVEYDEDKKPVYIIKDSSMEVYPKLNIVQTAGRSSMVKYNNKSYKLHIGTRGGKYIMVAGKKKYIA